MNKRIRKEQLKILRVFAENAKNFALSGGTALELYYLNHRFSADLDFFSPSYDLREMDMLISKFEDTVGSKIRLENELTAGGKARVRFYSIRLKNSSRPLKIDFVEDVILSRPLIKRFEGVRVYGVENIYLQKLVAIAGGRLEIDETGKEKIGGRREVRDVFDVYMLSKKIKPLHIFLKGVSSQLQRGVIHWYRTFSREEVKLGLLDLDIYDRKFDAKEMIIYLENEIKEFVKEQLK